jgi:hypothetical protein
LAAGFRGVVVFVGAGFRGAAASGVASSAAANCAADANRPLGDFDSALATTSSSAGENFPFGNASFSVGGAFSRCIFRRSATASARNGFLPVSISNSNTPTP